MINILSISVVLPHHITGPFPARPFPTGSFPFNSFDPFYGFFIWDPRLDNSVLTVDIGRCRCESAPRVISLVPFRRLFRELFAWISRRFLEQLGLLLYTVEGVQPPGRPITLVAVLTLSDQHSGTRPTTGEPDGILDAPDLLEQVVDFGGEVHFLGLGPTLTPAVLSKELLPILDENIIALHLNIGQDFPLHSLLDDSLTLAVEVSSRGPLGGLGGEVYVQDFVGRVGQG